MDIAKGKDSEHDMKDAISRAQDLLERLKNRKTNRLIDVKGSADPDQPMGNGNTGKTEDKPVSSFLQRRNNTPPTSVGIKPSRSQEVLSEQEPPSPDEAEKLNGETKLTPQKRKQDQFVAEIHDRAEVISKSARQSADKVVSSIPAGTLEDDAEASEFLRKIRAAPTSESEEKAPQEAPAEPTNDEVFVDASQERIKPRSHSSPSLDFSVIPMEVSTLNSAAAKDKMAVGRAGSIKGRRKPTAAARRSLKLSEEDTIMETTSSHLSTGLKGHGGMKAAKSEEFLAEISRTPSETEGLRPRTKPKPKPKSKTVAGIVLPGLADAIRARQNKEQPSSADLVREAAERKRTQVEREDKVEKEPDKPKWLAEAEARRKMHDRRRQLSPLDKPKGAETSPTAVSTKSEIARPVLISPTREKEPAKVESAVPISPNRVEGGAPGAARRPYRVLPITGEAEGATRGLQDRNENSLRSGTAKDIERQDSGSSAARAATSTKKPAFSRNRISRTPRSSESDRNEFSAASAPTAPVSPRTQETTSDSRRTTNEGRRATNDKCRTANDGQRIGGTRNVEVSSVAPAPKQKPSSEAIAIKPAAISSVTLRKSVGSESETELPNSPPGKTVAYSPRGSPPRILPKPTRSASQKVSVTPRETSPEKTEVERRRATQGRARPRPVSSFIPRSYSAKATSRRDSSDYNPTMTGEILPQWKLDLMERRRSVAGRADLPSQPAGPPTPTIPQWKKDLAERKKHREQATGLSPSSNKENQPREMTPEPAAQAGGQLRERRTMPRPPRPQSEIIETETADWRQKWSSLRRGQPAASRTSENSADGDAVPSFMREFQLKKRCVVQEEKPLPPTSTASYV